MKKILPYLSPATSIGTIALEIRDYLATLDDLAAAETNIEAGPIMKDESYDDLVLGNSVCSVSNADIYRPTADKDLAQS